MKSLAHLTASLAYLAPVLLAQATGPDPNDHTAVTVEPTTAPAPPTQTGCPTVTATGEICTTCPVPACLALSTVTQSCGCPTPVPTVTVDFPCDGGCGNVWCSTSYAIVPAATDCPPGGGDGDDGDDDEGDEEEEGPGSWNPSTYTVSMPTVVPPNSTTTATATTTSSASSSTSSFVSVNAAGRMRAPFWW